MTERRRVDGEELERAQMGKWVRKSTNSQSVAAKRANNCPQTGSRGTQTKVFSVGALCVPPNKYGTISKRRKKKLYINT